MTLLLLTGCFGEPGDISGVTTTTPPTTTDDSDSQETGSPAETAPPTGSRVLPPLGGGGEQYRFAVLGDYGNGSKESFEVAALVERLEPDFIITVGDNNYPNGEAKTMDANVGQLYHDWIGDYKGKYGEGSAENRFWPCPGNHDWYSDEGIDPYTDYFTLPGNERYYDFRYEDIHFFCVDSDTHEPDGTSADSTQGQWLKDAMTSSDAPVKIVYMHHPPYSSGSHGNNEWMHWPYRSWGADMLFGGHDHIYERQVHDGIPFIVTGIGGYRTYSVRDPTAQSQIAVSERYGVTLVRVFNETMIVETWSTEDTLLDRFRIRYDQPLTANPRLIGLGDEWSFTTEEPAEGWSAPGFDDSAWTVGYPEGSPIWARRQFTSQPGLSALTLEVVAEGSSEVFLNDSPLTGTVSGSISLLGLSTSTLVEGDNVLAVHSDGGTSESHLLVSLLGTGGTTLVEAGAEWHVTTEAPMSHWIRPGFDDSAWPTQAAPIAWPFEAPDTAGSGSPTAMWLRHHFTVSDPESVNDLLLSMARSDAAVVYLNEREVHRAGLPDGVLPEDTRATVAVESDWVTAQAVTLVQPELLVAGDNVLSVLVYTAAEDSTGLYFNLSLTGL